jgi:hypothetical protein
MAIYFFNLLSIIMFYLFVHMCHVKHKKILFCIYSFIQLSLLSGLRYKVGTDFLSYARHYERIVEHGMFYFEFEPGFNLLNLFSHRMNFGFQGVVLLSAIITVGCIMLVIYMYSDNPLLSVLLYCMLGFYNTSMNQIRTQLAVAIALLSIRYIKRKNMAKYCLIIVIASFFHVTALVMIPVYFMIYWPLNVKKIMITGIGISSALFLVRPIMEFSAKIYPRYSNYINSAFDYGYGIQSLFLIICLCLVIILHKKYLLRRNKYNIIYINYAVYGFIVSLFQLQFILMDRFVPYFMLPCAVLGWPEIQTCYERGISRRGINILLLAFGFLYCSFIVYRNWNGVVPYQFILTFLTLA